MSDHAQFEAMLEALINEDQETAKEIFHNIVVGKSREIYEELLESDFAFDEEYEEEDADGEVDPEEEEEEEEDADGEVDPEEEEEEEEEEEDDAAIEDRVDGLEAALEDLKAEFDAMLHDEDNEEDEYPGIHDDDAEAETNDFGNFGDTGEEEDEEETDDEFHKFMEYKHKILPKHGDNGDNTKSPVNTKLPSMGRDTKNIAQGGTADSKVANPATKPLYTKPVMNKQGGAKQKMSPVKGGNGAEKKGPRETPGNTKSPLKGR